MNHLNTVNNPIREAHPDKVSGMVVHLMKEDKALIQQIMPEAGCLQEVAQILFSNFCTKLRDEGIDYYSPNNVNSFLEILKD